MLLLNGMGDRPATMDLGLVNLYTGVLEMMKLGAAASFYCRTVGAAARRRSWSQKQSRREC